MSSNTRDQILDISQRLCQRLGHRGFSFREIAAQLGIKSASVHHYFPTKDDLLLALLVRYRAQFVAALQQIESSSRSSREALDGLLSTLEILLAGENRLCLCGILAADSDSLSPELRAEIANFFKSSSAWLANVLSAGQARGEFRFTLPAETVALAIISSAQGMLISSRVIGGATVFRQMGDWIRSVVEAPESHMAE